MAILSLRDDNKGIKKVDTQLFNHHDDKRNIKQKYVLAKVFFSCPGQLNKVTLSVGLSEPTNNQSLEIRNATETNTTVVKVRNTLDRAY